MQETARIQPLFSHVSRCDRRRRFGRSVLQVRARGRLAAFGGGEGSLVAVVLQRYPRMRAILFDVGHAAGRAQATLASTGPADQCELAEGDFF